MVCTPAPVESDRSGVTRSSTGAGTVTRVRFGRFLDGPSQVHFDNWCFSCPFRLVPQGMSPHPPQLVLPTVGDYRVTLGSGGDPDFPVPLPHQRPSVVMGWSALLTGRVSLARPPGCCHGTVRNPLVCLVRTLPPLPRLGGAQWHGWNMYLGNCSRLPPGPLSGSPVRWKVNSSPEETSPTGTTGNHPDLQTV